MIPGMIHRAYLAKKNNENFVIWGDGTPLRQFIHSEDLAKNILWALKNWNSETHFMAINEQEVSVMEIAKIITEKFELAEDQLIFDSFPHLQMYFILVELLIYLVSSNSQPCSLKCFCTNSNVIILPI
jgi:nucleoside-diphosphate-sugar epimerase